MFHSIEGVLCIQNWT